MKNLKFSLLASCLLFALQTHCAEESLPELFDRMHKEFKQKIENSPGLIKWNQVDRFAEILRTIQNHDDSHKKVLTPQKINDLRWMIYKYAEFFDAQIYNESLLEKLDDLDHDSNYAFSCAMRTAHEKKFGEYQYNDSSAQGFPVWASQKHCFQQLALNWPVGFDPNPGDDQVTAARLFQAYNQCAHAVTENRQTIAQEYTRMKERNAFYDQMFNDYQ